jgi:hypothetical protein
MFEKVVGVAGIDDGTRKGVQQDALQFPLLLFS